MNQQKDLIERIKDLPNWIKGAIGFVGAIIAFIALILGNVYLGMTVSVIVILAAAFCLCVYLAFSKKDSPIMKGRRIYLFSAGYRYLSFGGIVLIFIILGILLANSSTRSFAYYAVAGAPTHTPTMTTTFTSTPTDTPTSTATTIPTNTPVPIPTNILVPTPTRTLKKVCSNVPGAKVTITTPETIIELEMGTDGCVELEYDSENPHNNIYFGEAVRVSASADGFEDYEEYIDIVSDTIWVEMIRLYEPTEEPQQEPTTPAPVTSEPPRTPTPTPTLYPPVVLTAPDNGRGVFGSLPVLSWVWDRELGEDEYFEVRVWHEQITNYRPGLGWVKVPIFDFNIGGERAGKYYWTVVIVKDENVRYKDWYKPEEAPYPVWEHNDDVPTDSIQIVGLESEVRFFFFTPSKGGVGDGSAISKPAPPGGK